MNKYYKDIVCFLTLLIIGFKLSFQIEKITDIYLSDEAVYLERGVNIFLNKDPDGFIYFVWIKFLSFFTSSNFDLYFLNCSLLIVIPPILFFILLRVLKVTSYISFLYSAILMISILNIYMYPFITKFALSILLCGLIIIHLINNNRYKLLFSILTSFILLYVRPEFFLPFICLIITLGIYIVLNIKKLKIFQIIKLILPVLILLLIVFSYNPTKGPRSFIAFAQQYVRDVNDRNGIYNTDISEKIIEKHFGNNRSVFKVIKNQPEIFVEHVYYNLKRLPEQISSIFPYFTYQKMNYILKIFLSMIVITQLLISIYIYIRYFKIKSLNIEQLIVILFLLPSLISTLIFYPRFHYILIFEVMVMLFTILMVSYYLNTVKQKSVNSYKLIIVSCISLIMFIPNRFQSKSIHETECTTIGIINSINNYSEKSNIQLLIVASGISPFLNSNIKCISPKYFDDSYDNFIKEYNINMVLINDNLLQHRNIKDNPEFLRFKNDTNFISRDIQNCSEELLVKNNKLIVK